MSGSSNALLDAIANPRQVDVAGAYGTANKLAAGIWQNRLAQSQQAAGQAALGAINPDGTFNNQRLNQNLAADPSTAMSAQESMQRGSTNATTDFDLHMKRLTGLNAAAMALTAQYPNGVPQDAVNKEIDRVAPTYGISTQEAARLKSQFPGDPVGNSRVLIRNGIANLTAQESLHASRPGATTVDTGPAVVGANVAPAAADQPGALTPAGQGVQLQTGPGANAALVEVSDAAGNKYNVPRMSLPGASGVTRGVRAPADYSGQPNPLLGGLPNPQENGAPAGATLSSIGPAKSAALATTGGQSAGAFKEVSDQGVAAQSRGAVLDNMLSDTSQFTSGPGTDAIARVRAVANRLGLNVNTEGLSAVESFKKLAAALNANQGSDARLLVSEASNPHADMSPAGVDLMIRQLRGNEDYNLTRAKLAATYPDKTDKIGFEAKIGAQLDPRTFQYDRMTQPQKSTFFKSIDDKDKFIKAHDAATALLGTR